MWIAKIVQGAVFLRKTALSSINSPYTNSDFAIVAAEEARSGADGQHAQVPPRADAERARTRPALGGRRTQQLSMNACLHGNPAVLRIPCTLANFHGLTGGLRGGWLDRAADKARAGIRARRAQLAAWRHRASVWQCAFSENVRTKLSVRNSK
jgi:hypothetical protein